MICSICNTGTFAAATPNGASSCTCQYTAATCPIGTYVNYPSSCTACPIGTFSSFPGSPACTPCGPGMYTLATGSQNATFCRPCPAGNYCPGVSAPLPCPAGYASPAAGNTTACARCAPGTYSLSPGALACTTCPQGAYCTGGSAIEQCPANTFSAALGSGAPCAACPVGTVSGAGAAACIPAVYDPLAQLANTTLVCNASVALSTLVPLARVVAFPASANVSDAAPLVYLPASSPLNGLGVDVIVASASACAAFAATPGAAAQCSPALPFALPGGAYTYLGTAASLGMTAAPSCGS